MKAGTLNRYVSVQQPPGTDDMGGPLDGPWTEVTKAWASIEPITGREYHAAQAERSGVTHTINMRFMAFQSNWRIVDLGDGEIYEVLGRMNMDTADKQLRLMARTGVTNGG